MRRFLISFLLVGILLVHWGVPAPVASAQTTECLFFTETGGGQGGFSVCDDGLANFKSAFERWGLQQIGFPISQRYERDGFVTQAFQKAIMQWRPEGNHVALVNIFDDLHNAGYDERLYRTRQTPHQFPAGWDGEGLSFEQVVEKRQGLLARYPALERVYFSSSDPLTFFGLPTSEVTDMGNHYAIRLQRAVLQQWKEDVPWARAGQVTIANGGDIAKELGSLPPSAMQPQAGVGQSPAPAPAPAPPVTVPREFDALVQFAASDVESFWKRVFASQQVPYRPVSGFHGYSEPIDTECGRLEMGNAAYCWLNGAIYYDPNFLQVLYNDYGGFAVVNVIAHEWAHHVHRELDLITRYTIQDELLADCLAGVYSWDAESRGLLREEDLVGSSRLFYDLGDSVFVQWFEPYAHGTPEQRQEAFEKGFYEGSNACFGME